MIFKKISTVILSMLLLTSIATGCESNADGSTESSEKDNTVTTTVITKAPETAEEFRSAMIERSITSTGNNARMKNAIEKAKSGEKTTVAYIGGSITEGLNGGKDGCYAKLSYNYFSETFGTGENVEYINAGMSGTPSVLGILRSQRDVLDYKPDVVFIEFAVNDAQDPTHKDAYESLVRTMLQSENAPAVVLLFTVLENGYTCQEQMQQVGEYYNLPMISVGDALTPELTATRMVWSDYASDAAHPNPAGHELITEFITNYYGKVIAEDKSEDILIPEEALFGMSLVNAKLIDSSNFTPTQLGSFVATKTIAQFPNGWRHEANGLNEPLIIDLQAKSVFVIYRENSTGNLGTTEIMINGEEPIISAKGISSDGWNNPEFKMLRKRPLLNDYEIVIKMLAGDEEKTSDILAIGYTD